jgi:hypothetical protein
MEAIRTLTSTAAPLPLPNIDTDQIIPKQFLKRIERTGYGEFLFFDWRRIQEGPDAGAPHPDFVLNHPHYKGAEILVAGKNFGCGSVNMRLGRFRTTASAASSRLLSPIFFIPTQVRTEFCSSLCRKNKCRR